MTLEEIVSQAEVAKAEHEASLGPIDHPIGRVFDALGIELRPGVKVTDTVTGQEVEVIHAGITQV